MASSETSKQHSENPIKNEDYNPKLDFYSDQFDPLLALRSASVKPPVANAKIFDNLNIYQSHVEKKRTTPANKKKTTEKTKNTTEGVIERRWLPEHLPTFVPRKPKKIKDVFTRMDAMNGPLSVLRKCKDNRLRIKIWTRHSHDIRGYCLGYVVAFDKHWNIILEDVEEVFKRPKRRKIPALDNAVTCPKVQLRVKPPQVVVIETTKQMETCTRKVPQLLIRGEHVAFIVVPESDNKDNIFKYVL